MIGVFDLTLLEDVATRFRSSIVPVLECMIREQDATEYFKQVIL